MSLVAGRPTRILNTRETLISVQVVVELTGGSRPASACSIRGALRESALQRDMVVVQGVQG